MYFCLSKPIECFTISSEGRKQTSEGSVSSYSLVEANIMGQEECINSVVFGPWNSGNWKLGMDIECTVPNVNDIEAKVFNYHLINMFFLDYFAHLEPILPNQDIQFISKTYCKIGSIKMSHLKVTNRF